MSEKIRQPLGEVTLTQRGFEKIIFKDISGDLASLQQSSAALTEVPGAGALWIGSDDANPKIMAANACMVGITTGQTTGWIPYPIPAEVLINTRMHLNRDQVAGLITVLQHWLETGSLKL